MINLTDFYLCHHFTGRLKRKTKMAEDSSIDRNIDRSSCMGSYGTYLTGVVMQISSIVFLSLAYPWQPEAVHLQNRFITFHPMCIRSLTCW